MYSYKKLTENKVDFKHELKNVPWWVCSVFDDIAWAWESMYRDVSPRDVNLHLDLTVFFAGSLAIAGSSAAAGLSTVFKHCLTTISSLTLSKMAKINAIF